MMQLLGLVLTYNFTDCDFQEIKKEYRKFIFSDLKSYINGVSKATFLNVFSLEE